jgi:hypothetical protein
MFRLYRTLTLLYRSYGSCLGVQMYVYYGDCSHYCQINFSWKVTGDGSKDNKLHQEADPGGMHREKNHFGFAPMQQFILFIRRFTYKLSP